MALGTFAIVDVRANSKHARGSRQAGETAHQGPPNQPKPHHRNRPRGEVSGIVYAGRNRSRQVHGSVVTGCKRDLDHHAILGDLRCRENSRGLLIKGAWVIGIPG
jgi:hypothetical protein